MENNSPLNAYSYMFKDNKFWAKYLVLFIMTVICVLPSLIPGNKSQQQSGLYSLLPLLCLIINMLYTGYSCACVKSLSEQHSNYMIPFFNIKTHGIIGLKWLAASILFGLAVGLVFLVAVIVLAIIGAISKAACVILGGILAIIVILLIGIYSPAFYRMYAVTQDVFAYFRIKEIFKSVADNKGHYLKYIGVSYLITFLYILGLVLFAALLPISAKGLAFNAIMAIVLSVFGAYLNMAFMYICAKCINY